jgi:hypothetical protein
MNEKLDALRDTIAAEFRKRMQRDGEVALRDIAEWLILRKRLVLIDGLSDLGGLIDDVATEINTDIRVEQLLRAKPELRDDAERLRAISPTFAVPLYFVLTLDDQRRSEYAAAMAVIYKLRIEEKQAEIDAMKKFNEWIAPVSDGHPEMTAEEAVRELKRQTDATIEGLEPPTEGRCDHGPNE